MSTNLPGQTVEATAPAGESKTVNWPTAACDDDSQPGSDVAKLHSALQSLGERLAGSASVRQVYGEPIVCGQRTVIPVARMGYGFGGGMGRGAKPGAGASARQEGEGTGAGGGVGAVPIGVVEVTPEGTRFIRFGHRRSIALAAGASLLLGFWLGRYRRD